MADETPTSTSAGVINFATGDITSDSTAISVALGFTPRWVRVFNLTDVIVWEKVAGMGATQAIKTVTAGTTTVDTGSAIVLTEDGFTISATAAGNAKSLIWLAQ